MLLSMQNVAKKVRCWHPVSLPVVALMGVVSAAMRFGGINLVNDAWVNNYVVQKYWHWVLMHC